jgi:hypothetical protein
MTLRIWHDDVRPAPEGWVRARTNDEAKALLLAGGVTEISLDHDLGAQDAEQFELDSEEWWAAMTTAGRAAETGFDLVEWMCQTGNVPERVTIHSWNPDGAARMAARLKVKRPG